ncbi:MAG: type II toxin-antitoxin system prevent-host-death family antitoxin [Opitutaceae bacterium]|nr:type II toxin-antitoxin system prevent-host-death family antitoxin [Opitutaceae bacterium]
MSESVEEIGAFEAKTKLSSLLAQVEKGRSFYITKHGRRVAEVRPVMKKRPRRVFGCGKGTVRYVAPNFDAPLDEFNEYK